MRRSAQPAVELGINALTKHDLVATLQGVGLAATGEKVVARFTAQHIFAAVLDAALIKDAEALLRALLEQNLWGQLKAIGARLAEESLRAWKFMPPSEMPYGVK